VRPTLFVDLGWAGAREQWLHPGRQTMSGAGIGASFLDGLLHFDVARGIHPSHGMHVDFYVEGRL
jgi:hemolysin activation/secretion protein